MFTNVNRPGMCILYTFWVILAVKTATYSQPKSFRKLETEVYRLNNELKYNESQALLLPILQTDTFSADDRYQAAILLSYTYKRVFDYQSALKYLSIALKFAKETQQKSQYVTTIWSEEAFVYFDTQDYPKADSLMVLLEKSDFKHISLENKSKLVMQRGYLLFLHKQYKQSDATYNKAITWMKASAPCDLPLIFVKKMQLYAAMNRLDLLTDALKKSEYYADSCHIIKYHLYVCEELLHIYESRNELARMAHTQKKLDSLNRLYAREENTASLHNQKEKILSEYSNQKLQRQQTSNGYLTAILTGLLLTVMLLLNWILVYRRRQRRMEAEFHTMKSELTTYMGQSKATLPGESAPAKEQKDLLNELSERQQEVLACMAAGMSNKMIADKLFISENTVKYHIKNIYLLLKIKDRKEFLVNIKK